MALPLLLGLAGSGLAGAGMLGGMGALTAGAIGSGLGSYLETGDLGQGIQTGLLSFLGGKALGSMMGGASGAGASEAASAATQGPLPGGLEANAMNQLSPANPFTASAPTVTSLPTSQMPSVFNPAPTVGPNAVGPTMASADASKLMAPKQGFLEGLASDPTKGMGFMESLPYTGGAGLTAALMQPPPEMDLKKTTFNNEEAEAADRQARTPGPNFRPGVSPEFDYFGPMKTSFNEGGRVSMPVPLDVMAARKMQEIYSEPLGKKFIYVDDDSAQEEKERFEETLLGKIFGGGSGKDMMGRRLALQATREQFLEDYPEAAERLGMAQGGIASLAYQEGGEMPNDKELISDAVDAIQGRDDTPERTLAMFVQRYGEDALRDLVDRVQSGEFGINAGISEGELRGAGDGMDDMIPATLEGEQDVVLSDGEFIVPADVVSGLGNGSSNAGSKALYEMMDRVREMRTGKKEQPDQVPQGQMLPA